MRLYGSLKRLVAYMFARQASAPSLDSDTDALYSDADGDLIYRSDTAGVETEQFVALRDTKTNFKSDTIVEATLDAGVTIGEVCIKGGLVDGIDVSAHAASTTEHGATGAVVGTTNSQTLTSKFLDGGTANATNKWKIPQDTLANIQLLTATEGLLVYATDVDTVYVGDGSNWVAVGSGTGQGEKNYITNPSAASSTTDWVASSVNLTIARTTTAAQCPREFTTKTAISLTSSTDEAYARFRFSLDDSDLSKKLKIALSFINADTSDAWRIEMWKNSTAAYDGTYTELSLSTDSSGDSYLPVTTGDYKSSFDTDTTAYLELRIVHNGTNSDVLYMSDVLVGPGSVIQGAVIGEWQSYTPLLTNGGTTSSNSGRWRRVGDVMEIETYHVFTSAGAGAEFKISLPSGYTIGTRAASISTGVATCGTATHYAGANFADKLPYAGAGSVISFLNEEGTDFAGSALANTHQFGMKVSVPIAEWAGSGTVNLAQNDVEYASNSGSSTTGDTTSFTYGPSGSPILAYSTTGNTGCSYRVKFQRPIQATDRITVELCRGNDTWQDMETAFPYQENDAASGAYGFDWYSQSSTEINVRFYSKATKGSAWSDFTSYKWRVRKTSAGAAVGFGTVSENSAGLMPASNTNLDNATATRLGLKQYLADKSGGSNDIAYNGGNKATIAQYSGAGTLTGVTRCVLIPYQTQEGAWRLKINGRIAMSATSRSGFEISINGVTTRNITTYTQTGSGFREADTYATRVSILPNSAVITLAWQTASDAIGCTFSLDIELGSKPTWAY